MGVVGDVTDRKDKPAYVRFERLPIEDKAASLREGRWVGKDVDYALITPPYSKDIFKQKVPQWFENLENDMRNGRIPQEWVDRYRAAYQAWQNGQEMPLHGTPIKGWGVISPAQQESLIRLNILTVEDLQGINDEGIKRIGMGALELRTKATAWLAQLHDKGALTQQMAAVETENTLLKSSVEALAATVETLKAQLTAQAGALAIVQGHAVSSDEEITADDILEEVEPVVRRKPGRPSNAEIAARK